MHHPLSYSLPLCGPGIIAGSLLGKYRESTGIPDTDSPAAIFRLLIGYIKAMTGRAQKGTDAASYTSQAHLLPNLRIEEIP